MRLQSNPPEKCKSLQPALLSKYRYGDCTVAPEPSHLGIDGLFDRQGDITTLELDVIVNARTKRLLVRIAPSIERRSQSHAIIPSHRCAG